jgi:hypothetical protein
MSPAAVIQLSGEDCFDFLQSQGTADLRSCQSTTGQFRRSLWLDHKGLIHGDGLVWRCEKDEWLLLSEYTPAARILEKFERHIIADDVELMDQTKDWELMFLDHYPDGIELPESEAGVAIMGEGWLLKGASIFSQGVSLLVSKGSRIPVDFTELNEPSMRARRIAARFPAMDKDISPGQWNPFETGLMDYVSLQKGCFLGQEVVARAHRLGRRSKRFVFARTQNCAHLGEEFSPISYEGNLIGEWTSIAEAAGQAIVLGWVKSRFPDGQLTTDDGINWFVESL